MDSQNRRPNKFKICSKWSKQSTLSGPGFPVVRLRSCGGRLFIFKKTYLYLFTWQLQYNLSGSCLSFKKGWKKVLSHKAFKSVSRNDDNITRGIIIYLEHVNHQRPPLRMPAKMMNSSAGWKSNPEEFTGKTLTAELPPSLSKLGRGEDLTDLKIQVWNHVVKHSSQDIVCMIRYRFEQIKTVAGVGCAGLPNCIFTWIFSALSQLSLSAIIICLGSNNPAFSKKKISNLSFASSCVQ